MSFFKDLFILNREIKYLPFIFATNDGEANNVWDETRILNDFSKNIPSIAKLTLEAGFGVGNWSDFPKIEKFGEIKKQDERWFFINGICTDYDQTFNINCKYLSYLFGTQITGMYNPTHGITPDLVECVTGRTFNVLEPFNIAYSTVIENTIKAGFKVKLIGHSQGGIIVSNIIRTLALKKVDFKNLEIFTFASAADGEQNQVDLFQEHFGNEEDMVSRIGLQAKEYYPKIFWKRAGGKGHLLNRNYLNAFVNGSFCNKKSKLYSMLSVKK